ncbi:hypothetical protein [Accumulibacter sp.]|uniref:hypothetical protein n=1 Tax=Accumulibacter sp. TaxID=2053492 RepID=UPI002588D303|nr:hypothetical protein [Accumulibacter sp.]MCM8579615.1 hypothetical protein [Accumulibacter sp.]
MRSQSGKCVIIKAASLLCVFLLMGCMTSYYIDVTEGKRAKLRVIHHRGNDIDIYPNSSTCINKNDPNAGSAISKVIETGYWVTGRSTFEKKLLDMPYPPKQNQMGYPLYFEFYIPAEKEFLVSMFSQSGYNTIYQCPLKYVLMKAKESHNYELSLTTSGNVCQYSMKEIAEDGKRLPVETWKEIPKKEVKICQ